MTGMRFTVLAILVDSLDWPCSANQLCCKGIRRYEKVPKPNRRTPITTLVIQYRRFNARYEYNFRGSRGTKGGRLNIPKTRL
jgi:hypothetical protein